MTRRSATVDQSRSGSHRSPHRRRPVRLRAWLLATGLALVFLAGALGLLTGVVVLPLSGLLLAAMVHGDGARPVARSRRTVAVAVSMLLGYAIVVAVLSVAARLRLSTATIGVVLVTLQVVATLVIALPLAMAERAAQPSRLMLTRRDLILAATGALTLTLAHLGGESFLVLATVAVLLPVTGAVWRGWQAHRGRLDTGFIRHPLRSEHRAHLLQALNLLVFAGLLAATTLPGSYDVLAPGSVSTVRAVILTGAVVLALLAWVPGRTVLVAANALVAAASLFVAAELAATYRLPAGAVTLRPPFAGEWYVVHGGHSELVNGHRANPSQQEALDLIQVTGGSSRQRGSGGVTDYHAFGQPLLAPADGIVVYVSETLADRPPSSPDPNPDNAEGNHLIIDLGGGRFLHLAHLEKGTALVDVGDRVSREQAIARVGNSGNSDEPHLHIQVQDSANPDAHHAGVRTFPILFSDVVLTRDGQASRPAAADLRRGDRFRSLIPS